MNQWQTDYDTRWESSDADLLARAQRTNAGDWESTFTPEERARLVKLGATNKASATKTLNAYNTETASLGQAHETAYNQYLGQF